jgi:phosphatidylinositol 4-kinase type 2
MTAAPSSEDEESAMPRLGAIDNSLSWPWKHPDAWRSYPFGWLFLPVTLIGRPFTDKTRRHFLPLLTSKEWWTDTQVKLRNCFELDADFKERMFARQIAVMKGQAWNVVETLKTPDHGPLELTRRQRACVWDDLVDIPVAMPMSRPSEEMRQQAKDLQTLRRHSGKEDSTAEHEEMDISAAYASAPAKPQPDLLGAFGEANENPFNTSRQNSSDLIPQIRQPTSEMMGLAQSLDVPSSASLLGAQRPVAMRSTTICPPRMSYDVPSRPNMKGWNLGKRRSSFSVRRIALGEDDEEDEEGEGDLGFGAAREREGMRRKVIVERLEMVKSKPPVFTWC